MPRELRAIAPPNTRRRQNLLRNHPNRGTWQGMARATTFTLSLAVLMPLWLPACAGPQLAAPDVPLDFGDVLVPTSKSQPLRLTASGGGAISVREIRVEGGDRTHFLVAAPGGGYPVSVTPPGELVTTVTFTPRDRKSYETDISAQMDAVKTRYLPHKTRGHGVYNMTAGYVRMDIAAPEGLDFGEPFLGSTTELPIAFINRSDKPRTFAITKPGPGSVFTTDIQGDKVTLPPGGRVTYRVVFRPQAAATYRDVIILKVDDDNFAGITLLGSGRAGG